MANCIIRVNKVVIDSNVLFDCDIDDDLENQIDKLEYSIAEVKEGATVTYTVVADGYFPVSNTIVADKDYTFTPELKKYVTLTIIPYPETSKVIISYDGNDYEQNSLKVLSNTPVKYTVSKEKRETVSDTVMLNSDETINVSLKVLIKGDLGIGEFEGINSDGLSNINLIDKKEYERLTEKQRSNYVRFDPWLNSYIGADVTKAINDCLIDLYWSLPIVKKLAPFTGGAIKFNGDTLLTYIGQLNSIMASAQNIGDQLKRIQKAASKVGLGSIINIFTMAFKLIGGLAGMVYSILYNPQVLLRPYLEMFKNYDLKYLYDRTIGTTIPNLEYVKANLNRIYFPDGDIKDNLFGKIKEIDAATEISANVLEMVQQLGEMVDFSVNVEKGLEAALRMMSTMGLDWALGELAKTVTGLKLDYDDIAKMLNNNALSQASESLTKNINDIMNGIETKYIRVQDLEYIKEMNKDTKNNSLEEYTNGYQDALKNAQLGEYEEEMEARLAKYKSNLEKQNKDPSSYIDGYRMGWQIGQKLLENEKKNLDTQAKKDSYQKGYEDGYAYAQNIRNDAYEYLSLGSIYGFIDVDNHIHDYNYQPIGRIDGDKVLSFPDEQIIGSYNNETKELIINDVKYNVNDNIIIDESVEGDISEDSINTLCEYLYKLNLIMIERSDPKNGYINPYYSSGWKDGFKYKNEENISMNNYVNDDEQGELDGYLKSSKVSPKNLSDENGNKVLDEQFFNYLSESVIPQYKEQHPYDYYYSIQGLIRGVNKFQSEYNDGYSNGYWSAMNRNDYDSLEEEEIARINELTEYCSLIGTTIEEQESYIDDNYYKRDSRYRGWTDGWSDKLNNFSEDYKEMYYNNNY